VPLPAIAGRSYVGPPATPGVYHAYIRTVTDRRTELVQKLVEMWNSGDVDAFCEAVGPDFQFTPDPSFPETGPYSGEELRKWLREWQGTWEGNRYEVLGIDDHGQAMTIDSRWHLVAKGTGDQVPASDFTIVFWLDADDRPRGMAAFFDRDRALEVARGGTG